LRLCKVCCTIRESELIYGGPARKHHLYIYDFFNPLLPNSYPFPNPSPISNLPLLSQTPPNPIQSHPIPLRSLSSHPHLIPSPLIPIHSPPSIPHFQSSRPITPSPHPFPLPLTLPPPHSSTLMNQNPPHKNHPRIPIVAAEKPLRHLLLPRLFAP